MKNKFFIWIAVLFATIYLFTSSPINEEEALNTVHMATSDFEVSQGKGVVLDVKNNTKETWKYEAECPAEPFKVFRYEAGDWKQLEANADHIECEDKKMLALEPGQNMTIDYDPWKLALFFEKGRYQIRADLADGKGNRREFISNDFTVTSPSLFTNVWRQGLYRPFYNLLIALVKYLPYHSLGLAIILMTFLIRLALLAPSQKAMRAQRQMQDIQPKLEKIKEKYKGDQQRIAQETMRIWKDNKVNPMGSCLPLLIQFPVLIALFYVVQEGLDPNNVYLLYGPLQGFDLSLIESNFLGILDLTKANLYVLPLIVGLLQFGQMKLAMSKKPKQEKKKKAAKGEPDLAAVNNIMIYMMPVLIAVFTASLPSGVGLYWAVSTLFGIGQQFVVNKTPGKKPGKNGGSSSDGEVRVKILN